MTPEVEAPVAESAETPKVGAPEVPKTKASTKWTCQCCTLVNKKNDRKCKACLRPRYLPKSPKPPPSSPVDTTIDLTGDVTPQISTQTSTHTPSRRSARKQREEEAKEAKAEAANTSGSGGDESSSASEPLLRSFYKDCSSESDRSIEISNTYDSFSRALGYTITGSGSNEENNLAVHRSMDSLAIQVQSEDGAPNHIPQAVMAIQDVGSEMIVFGELLLQTSCLIKWTIVIYNPIENQEVKSSLQKYCATFNAILSDCPTKVEKSDYYPHFIARLRKAMATSDFIASGPLVNNCLTTSECIQKGFPWFRASLSKSALQEKLRKQKRQCSPNVIATEKSGTPWRSVIGSSIKKQNLPP